MIQAAGANTEVYARLAAAGSLVGARPAEMPKSEDEALRLVAREFEAIFVGELLKTMRNTTLESGLFGQDRASKIYREMHDSALSREMALSGRMGIADMVYAELSRRPGDGG